MKNRQLRVPFPPNLTENISPQVRINHVIWFVKPRERDANRAATENLSLFFGQDYEEIVWCGLLFGTGKR